MISVQDWAAWLNKGNASIPHLLLEHYKKLNITDEEMMLIIHLHAFLSQGIRFPSIEQLQERLTCTPAKLTQMLNRLHKERFILIETSYDQEGRVHETYSLEPLWEKLIRFLALQVEDETVAAKDDQIWPETAEEERVKQLQTDIFRHFESEFGRPLSPIEYETISMWLDEDKYDVQLIYLALREAIISNKLSLRYIDRILIEWQKHGLKTLHDVCEHTKKFRQHQANRQLKKSQENKAVSFSFYNWLEN